MSAPKFRLRSKAFRGGLYEGLASPLYFFCPNAKFTFVEYDDNLRVAWEAVSDAIEEVYTVECTHGGKSGKTSVTSKTRPEHAYSVN